MALTPPYEIAALNAELESKAEASSVAAALALKADAAATTAALATKADDAATTAALALKATTVALTAEENARKAAETIRLTAAASGDGLAYTATSPVTLVAGSRFTLRTPAIANAGNCTLAATGLSPATIRSRDNQNLLAGMLQASTQYDFVVDSTAIVRCLGLSRGETDKVVTLESTTAETAATLAGQVAAVGDLQTQVQTILNPGFASAAPYTRAGFGAPTAGLPPVDIGFFEVDGVEFARFTNLATASFVILAIRDVVRIRPNTTYRLTVIARLLAATTLGTDQVRLQFNRLDADYDLLDATAASLDLTATYQTFTVEWPSGAAPAADFFRASFFKMNSYSDATGAIDVKAFFISDLTNGAELPQRVAALEAGGSVGGDASLIPPMALATLLPVPSGVPARAPIENDSAGWFALAPAERQATVINTVANPKYDLTHMIPDTVVEVAITTTTAQFYAGPGKTFAGAAQKMLDVAGPGLVKLSLHTLNRLTAITQLGTPTYSNPADPIMARSAVVIGQSNGVNFVRHGGVGGFTRACRDAAWLHLGVIDPEAHWINGATGATAVMKSSVAGGATNWWYDRPTGDIGVPFQYFFDQVSAAVAAGQPAPTTVIHLQGESEVFALENGTSTVTDLKNAIKDIWSLTRDFLITKGADAGDIKIFHVAMGTNEPGALRRVGGSRVRQAFALAVAETAYAHSGVQAYDIERAPGDIHYTARGYEAIGRRLARLYANVVHSATYDLGPVVSGAVLADDQRTVTLTLSSTGTLLMPDGLHGNGVTLGRDPDTLGGAPFLCGLVTPAGGLIKLSRAEVSGSTYVLTFASDIPAGSIVTGPFGYAPEARWRDFATDAQKDVAIGMPGLPLQDFAIAL